MNSVLWIIQIVLALLFLLIGGLKVVLPLHALQRIMPLAKRIPTTMRLIGISELLGVIGLLAPGLTGIQPWLTVTAALGLSIILIGALVVHTRNREFSSLGLPVLMLLLALFVVVGRGLLFPL
ncbi:MAG TPA: DoxX family protein [Ktedonobacteraceae bacterium]|nr:DoxX family protein [Ktedonobacteraceae bacterium]